MSAARRRRGKGGSRGRRRGKKKEQVGFWGEVDKLPPAKQDVRITSEAAAGSSPPTTSPPSTSGPSSCPVRSPLPVA